MSSSGIMGEIEKVLEEAEGIKESSEWIFLIQDKVIESYLKGKKDLFRNLMISDEIFWIGIGGSSSGPKAISEIFGLGIKFFESPEEKKELCELMKKSKRPTLYIVSKSGETFETLILSKTAEKIAKRKKAVSFLGITANKDSPISNLVIRNRGELIDFPPNLSGRFSTFFILYPILMRYRNILKIMKSNLDNVRRRIFDKESLHFKLARFIIENQDKQEIFLCFYSKDLVKLSENFCQLIAESLGKDGKGLTPVALLGPHFQHSVAQLILANPKGKCAVFIFRSGAERDLMREKEATLRAFSERIPVLELEIRSKGEIFSLIFQFQIAIAVAGKIMGINPFDQPEVKRIRDLIWGGRGLR
ncbi:Glucose-6-phosphate isomerase [bacterium HR19]|nr:Glucose-6-phosphate isomerase [bacterium HR19]